MFPSFWGKGFANPSGKSVTLATAYRKLLSGDTVWVGENGYAYRFSPVGTKGKYVGGSAGVDDSLFPMANGDFYLSASQTAHVFITHSFDGSINRFGSDYNASQAVGGACADSRDTTKCYAWGKQLDSTKVYTIVNGLLSTSWAHPIGVIDNKAMVQERPIQNDLLIFGCLNAGGYPTVAAATKAGVQTIAATTVEANAADNNHPHNIVVLPDGGFVCQWKRNSNYTRFAIFNADGSVRVPSTIMDTGNIPGNSAANTPSGGVLIDGTVVLFTSLSAYKIDPCSGAVITSVTLASMAYSAGAANLAFGAAAFGYPVVIAEGERPGTCMILDPYDLSLLQAWQGFEGVSDRSVVYYGKLATGDLVAWGSYFNAAGSQSGVHSQVIQFDQLKTRYRVQADAAAGSQVRLEAI